MMSLSEDLNLVLERLRECGEISTSKFRDWSSLVQTGLANFVREQGCYFCIQS